MSKPNQTTIEALLKKEGVWAELPEVVQKALEPIMKAEGMSDKGKTALVTAMKVLHAAKSEIPEETMKAIMGAAGYGSDDEGEEDAGEEGDDAGTADTAGADDAAAAAAAAAADGKEKEKKEADGYGMPAMKEDGSLDLDGVPEKVRPVLQALWKEKQEKDVSLAKVQKQLDTERDQRVTKEFCDRAAVLKHVGMKSDELGPVLKEISEKAPAAFKKLEPLLKSLDEKVRKSALFTEIGSSASKDASGGSGGGDDNSGQTEAEVVIANIAKSKVAKDDTLTQSQAVAKAWGENPALYTQHVQEKKQRLRA